MFICLHSDQSKKSVMTRGKRCEVSIYIVTKLDCIVIIGISQIICGYVKNIQNTRGLIILTVIVLQEQKQDDHHTWEVNYTDCKWS